MIVIQEGTFRLSLWLWSTQFELRILSLCLTAVFFLGSPLKILRTLKRVKFTDNFIITERYLFFSSLNNAPKSFLWGFYFHFRF